MSADEIIPFRLEESGGNVHLSDPLREHDTDTLDCWCHPSYYRVCECDEGCWQCCDDQHVLTRADAEWCNDPILVVHTL